MVLFQGDKRLLEKVHSELNTTTNTNRQLEIYGVKSYDELINVIIPVSSSIKGIPGDVTININNLGDKPLKLFINKLKSSPDFDWIDIGQIYYIIYDGVDFIAFGGNIPVKAESVEDIVYISSTILSVTNESTSEEITNLFGESKDITAFINALTNNEHILLSAETTAECISVIAQGTLLSETESTDYIEVIDTNGHYKRLEFKRELGVLDTYLSVNIIDKDLGGNTESSSPEEYGVFHWDGLSSSENPNNLTLWQKIVEKAATQTVFIFATREPYLIANSTQGKGLFVINQGDAERILTGSSSMNISGVTSGVSGQYDSTRGARVLGYTTFFGITYSNGKVTAVTEIKNSDSSSSYYLPTSGTNITGYTPTYDYHPATKKYVDDTIQSAITGALEGSY